jgi:hypothetical protein
VRTFDGKGHYFERVDVKLVVNFFSSSLHQRSNCGLSYDRNELGDIAEG